MGPIQNRSRCERTDVQKGMLQLDLNGQITGANLVACELLHRSSEELVSSRIQRTMRFYLDDKPIRDLVARIAFEDDWMNEGTPRCVTQSGRQFTLTPESGPYRNACGQVEGTVLCFQSNPPSCEITCNNDSALDLNESRILSRTNIGAWVWDVPTGALKINSCLSEMLGLSCQECENLTIDIWHSLCHPDDAERAQKLIQMAFQGDIENYELELRLRAPDGSWIWVIDRGFVSRRDENGNATGMSGVFLDMSRLKTTERKLNDSERRYREIFEHSSAIKILVDPVDGRIVEANTAASRFYGYTPTEMRSLRVWDINTKTSAEALKCLKKASNREVQNFDFKHRLSNGELRDVHVFAGPLQMDDRVLVHSIIVDVTDQILAEHALRRMQQIESLGTLAGGIAHDFNNVLTAIFANLSVAKHALENDHKAYRFLEEATKSIQRAKGLSNQLLTFAKGEAPCRKLTSLGQLIHNVVPFDLSGSNVKPEFDLQNDLWAVEADGPQLQQVFSNLTLNAKQAMPNGGRIHVSAANCELTDDCTLPDGRYVRITVQDSGCGIPPAELERVFEPYFTTRNEGHGLGLATSFSIIQKHGGRIDVQSEVNVGTSFIILLPAVIDERITTQPTQVNASASTAIACRRALIVDDEPAILEAIYAMLARMDIQMVGCQNADDAVAAFRQAQATSEPFDFALLDLTIPGGTGGLEIARQLRAIDPDVRLICSSGYAAHPVMNDCSQHGFHAALAKPYLFTDLLRTIRTAVR